MILALYLRFKLIEKQSKKEELERQINYEKEHQKYKLIRQTEFNKQTPDFIQGALNEFLHNSSQGLGSNYYSFNDFSPLKCFGYAVGKTSGVSENRRREIIYYTWYATIPSVIPKKYASEWGEPGTYKRFDKIISHLNMLANQRANRKSYEVAISDWKSDAEWFEKEFHHLANCYKTFGFEK